MRFVRVAAHDEVAEGALKGVEAEGEEILLACVEGRIYAIEGICNHGLAYLEEGHLEGHEVMCPLHHGCFDVRSGAATRTPCTTALKSYPIHIEGRDVLVGVE